MIKNNEKARIKSYKDLSCVHGRLYNIKPNIKQFKLFAFQSFKVTACQVFNSFFFYCCSKVIYDSSLTSNAKIQRKKKYFTEIITALMPHYCGSFPRICL